HRSSRWTASAPSWPESGHTRRTCLMKRRSLFSGVAFALLVAAGCSHPPPPPAVTRNLTLMELEQAVRLRNPSTVTIVTLANQYPASGQDADGHAYFCERSTQVPDRAAFRAFCGLFQVRMSATIPLLQRKDWVKDGMAKLDEAAATDGLSRYLRGVVAAELPESFGRAQQAADGLQWVLAQQKAFPPGLRRATYFGLAHAYRTLGKVEESKQALAQAGAPSDSPPLVTDFSVNAQDGFRFSAPTLVEVAPNIYVARGYAFADIAFIG